MQNSRLLFARPTSTPALVLHIRSNLCETTVLMRCVQPTVSLYSADVAEYMRRMLQFGDAIIGN